MDNSNADNKIQHDIKIIDSDLEKILKKTHKKLSLFIVLAKNALKILRIPVKIFLYPLVYFSLLIRPFIKDLFFVSLAIVFFLIFVPFFTYWVYAEDLNNKEKIMNSNDTGIVLLDRNDKPFFTFYEVKKKTFVPIDSIPKHVQLAVVAMEDREFYQHSGFSVRGIVRSIIEDIKQQELVSGGSTITQQLVKNSLLNPQKNFLRKYQEVTLAYEIERRFSKEDILEMYLNSVYFGEGAFGIEEAAKIYFGKEAKNLSLAEAAILAAILPAPSTFSPKSGNFKEAKLRQEIVLERMMKQNFITHEQWKEALDEQLTFVSESDDLNLLAPHFALMVRDELIKKYGEETIARSGFRVKTSLDLNLQSYAEDSVKEQVEKLTSSNVTNGAAVAIDPKTGEMLVLVGSKSWFDENFGKVNVVTALRQPGSAFKPIVYAAAFEKGLITPATILKDNPITYAHGSGQGSPAYRPVNYDRKFRGNVTVRRALANSLNVPAVEVLNKLGVSYALDMASNLGISSLNEPGKYGLSLTLGAAEVQLLELTQAYGVFANEGKKNEGVKILQIIDKHNNIIYQYHPNPKQVLKPEYAFLISSILSDNKTRAEVFGNELTISKPAAVKTGTSENYKDSLTVGFTPSIVVGVWVGNNDGREMNSVAGSLGAAPIWKKIMEEYLKDKPVEEFKLPQNIEKVYICKHNGLPIRTTESTAAGILEYFVKGTVPNSFCNSRLNPSPTVKPKGSPKVQEENGNYYQEINLRDGSLLQLSVSGNYNRDRININYQN